MPIPKYYCAKNLDEAYQYAEKIKYPVIIKPSDNQSSRIITKDKSENIAQSFNLALQFYKSKTVLIEELLIGYGSVEICVTEIKFIFWAYLKK